MGLSAPLLETDVPVARTAGDHGGTGPAGQSLQDLQDSGKPQDIPEELLGRSSDGGVPET